MSFKHWYSSPDLTPRQSPFSGRIFIRDWPKICATCGDTFYHLREENDYPMPRCVDPEPPIIRHGQWELAQGLRGTCGDPKCLDAEQEHQAQRSANYRDAASRSIHEPNGNRTR